MLQCRCGCNQNLTRKGIKKHLQGRSVPCLVTAVVRACRRRDISPPRLQPSRKFRSSRRYFPSSPASVTVDEEPDFVMLEGDRNVASNIVVDEANAKRAINAASDIVVDEANVERAINAAQEDIWSGLHHDDNDAEEEDDDYAGDEGSEDGEEAAGNVEGDYDEWDGDETGLSPLELLGEDFERNSITNGELWGALSSVVQLINFNIAGKLSERDMSILRAYAFKIDGHLTDEMFSKIPYAFPKEPVPTVKVCKSQLQALSGFKPIQYDSCINSCCCFAGEHKDRAKCPYCTEDRYIIGPDGKKKPRKVFNYLPFIPRLVSMYANPIKAQEMWYRAFEHEHTAGKISDIFDSHIYRRLLGKKVAINGSHASHEYFTDPRDIALGLSTDGFCPFKRRKTTTWPLILFNYNLPPETRFHSNNKIDLSTIPGPNKPKDFDSFTWPIFEEFMRLQYGVKAFDTLADEFFLL